MLRKAKTENEAESPTIKYGEVSASGAGISISLYTSASFDVFGVWILSESVYFFLDTRRT